VNPPHPTGNTPAPATHSSFRTVIFTCGFDWFAFWLAGALLLFAMRDFQSEASQPPPSTGQLLLTALIFVAIAAPGLLIAILATSK